MSKTIRTGQLICYYGPMFSGKTARMMLDVKKITACGLRSMTIKNSIDERTMQAVWSRFNDIKEEAHSCKNLKEITIMDEVDVIAIDEGQFFEDLVPTCLNWVHTGKIVMVTGLNLDYMGQPFSNMAHLVAIADKVIFLKATCKNCSEFKPALYSHFLKKDNESGRIIIGDANYIPLCRNCYYICN